MQVNENRDYVTGSQAPSGDDGATYTISGTFTATSTSTLLNFASAVVFYGNEVFDLDNISVVQQ